MTDAVPEADPAAHPVLADWRPLPPRARSLFMLSHATMGLALAVPVAIVSASTHYVPMIPAVLGALVIGAGLGAWLGAKRFRSRAWRLDEDGFGYRSGRLFHRETRVPASRVQHLDLRHGPFERHWKLATLVIHTAGSKMSAVSVTGLDADDAEVLRDRLARQLETDDAL
ncbi:membrane protein [Lysobacter helvus]|uniref:Membrane protein n=2 Tax=Lysobacteraceae TaxID=32033 RepID=A0ABN6FSZ4_9GAMM|nr:MULTISPECIES: PH domain-containing protein [Lysobacter]BCT92040.1 membrane protein [Lysobacter caseinilyticus]BCT95193.1 membrane protein [Lysobacter helvus]